MKEPCYFADEKELLAKIFEVSDELTKYLNSPPRAIEAQQKDQKPKTRKGPDRTADGERGVPSASS